MEYPVDKLATVDPESLEQSAKDYMSKLLYRNSEKHECLSIPGSNKIEIGLCNVSFVPLYGVDIKHKILAVFSPEDPFKAVGLYLLDQWWSAEDILKTADLSRTGLIKVRTPGERIVLYVLNRIIYRTKEMVRDDVPFLCHGEDEVVKILWKNGEAIGFYSVKPEGRLCSRSLTQHYHLPVMDTIFVRKCHRANGHGLQMLEDFVDSFRKDLMGLKYPLSPAMYKVCKKYLSLYPEDTDLLWEIEGAGSPFQRTQISRKLQAMDLKGNHQVMGKLNFDTEDGDIPVDVGITQVRETREYRKAVEEVVQIKITKEVQDTPVSACGKSRNLKHTKRGTVTEEATEKIIRIEDIEPDVQCVEDDLVQADSKLYFDSKESELKNDDDKVEEEIIISEQTEEPASEMVPEDVQSTKETTPALKLPKAAVVLVDFNKASMMYTNINEDAKGTSQPQEDTTETMTYDLTPVSEITHLHCEEQKKLAPEPTYQSEIEKEEVVEISPVVEIQSLKGNEDAQIMKSFEATILPVDLQPLELKKVEEVGIVKMPSETEELKEKAGEVKELKDEIYKQIPSNGMETSGEIVESQKDRAKNTNKDAVEDVVEMCEIAVVKNIDDDTEEIEGEKEETGVLEVSLEERKQSEQVKERQTFEETGTVQESLCEKGQEAKDQEASPENEEEKVSTLIQQEENSTKAYNSGSKGKCSDEGRSKYVTPLRSSRRLSELTERVLRSSSKKTLKATSEQVHTRQTKSIKQPKEIKHIEDESNEKGLNQTESPAELTENENVERIIESLSIISEVHSENQFATLKENEEEINIEKDCLDKQTTDDQNLMEVDNKMEHSSQDEKLRNVEKDKVTGAVEDVDKTTNDGEEIVDVHHADASEIMIVMDNGKAPEPSAAESAKEEPASKTGPAEDDNTEEALKQKNATVAFVEPTEKQQIVEMTGTENMVMVEDKIKRNRNTEVTHDKVAIEENIISEQTEEPASEMVPEDVQNTEETTLKLPKAAVVLLDFYKVSMMYTNVSEGAKGISQPQKEVDMEHHEPECTGTESEKEPVVEIVENETEYSCIEETDEKVEEVQKEANSAQEIPGEEPESLHVTKSGQDYGERSDVPLKLTEEEVAEEIITTEGCSKNLIDEEITDTLQLMEVQNKTEDRNEEHEKVTTAKVVAEMANDNEKIAFVDVHDAEDVKGAEIKVEGISQESSALDTAEDQEEEPASETVPAEDKYSTEEAMSALKLQNVSVVLVDFNKFPPKHKSDDIDMDKGTSQPKEEVIQELLKPEITDCRHEGKEGVNQMECVESSEKEQEVEMTENEHGETEDVRHETIEIEEKSMPKLEDKFPEATFIDEKKMDEVQEEEEPVKQTNTNQDVPSEEPKTQDDIDSSKDKGLKSVGQEEEDMTSFATPLRQTRKHQVIESELTKRVLRSSTKAVKQQVQRKQSDDDPEVEQEEVLESHTETAVEEKIESVSINTETEHGEAVEIEVEGNTPGQCAEEPVEDQDEELASESAPAENDSPEDVMSVLKLQKVAVVLMDFHKVSTTYTNAAEDAKGISQLQEDVELKPHKSESTDPESQAEHTVKEQVEEITEKDIESSSSDKKDEKLESKEGVVMNDEDRIPEASAVQSKCEEGSSLGNGDIEANYDMSIKNIISHGNKVEENIRTDDEAPSAVDPVEDQEEEPVSEIVPAEDNNSTEEAMSGMKLQNVTVVLMDFKKVPSKRESDSCEMDMGISKPQEEVDQELHKTESTDHRNEGKEGVNQTECEVGPSVKEQEAEMTENEHEEIEILRDERMEIEENMTPMVDHKFPEATFTDEKMMDKVQEEEPVTHTNTNQDVPSEEPKTQDGIESSDDNGLKSVAQIGQSEEEEDTTSFATPLRQTRRLKHRVTESELRKRVLRSSTIAAKATSETKAVKQQVQRKQSEDDPEVEQMEEVLESHTETAVEEKIESVSNNTETEHGEAVKIEVEGNTPGQCAEEPVEDQDEELASESTPAENDSPEDVMSALKLQKVGVVLVDFHKVSTTHTNAAEDAKGISQLQEDVELEPHKSESTDPESQAEHIVKEQVEEMTETEPESSKETESVVRTNKDRVPESLAVTVEENMEEVQKESDTVHEIPGEEPESLLDTDSSEDNEGERSDAAIKLDEEERASSVNPLRCSRRLKDQAVKGELRKRVLRSSARLKNKGTPQQTLKLQVQAMMLQEAPEQLNESKDNQVNIILGSEVAIEEHMESETEHVLAEGEPENIISAVHSSLENGDIEADDHKSFKNIISHGNEVEENIRGDVSDQEKIAPEDGTHGVAEKSDTDIKHSEVVKEVEEEGAAGEMAHGHDGEDETDTTSVMTLQEASVVLVDVKKVFPSLMADCNSAFETVQKMGNKPEMSELAVNKPEMVKDELESEVVEREIIETESVNPTEGQTEDLNTSAKDKAEKESDTVMSNLEEKTTDPSNLAEGDESKAEGESRTEPFPLQDLILTQDSVLRECSVVTTRVEDILDLHNTEVVKGNISTEEQEEEPATDLALEEDRENVAESTLMLKLRKAAVVLVDFKRQMGGNETDANKTTQAKEEALLIKPNEEKASDESAVTEHVIDRIEEESAVELGTNKKLIANYEHDTDVLADEGLKKDNTTLKEKSTSTELDTNKTGKECRDSAVAAQSDSIHKSTQDEDISVYPSRTLRPRTLPVKATPERKSRRLQNVYKTETRVNKVLEEISDEEVENLFTRHVKKRTVTPRRRSKHLTDAQVTEPEVESNVTKACHEIVAVQSTEEARTGVNATHETRSECDSEEVPVSDQQQNKSTPEKLDDVTDGGQDTVEEAVETTNRGFLVGSHLLDENQEKGEPDELNNAVGRRNAEQIGDQQDNAWEETLLEQTFKEEASQSKEVKTVKTLVRQAVEGVGVERRALRKRTINSKAISVRKAKLCCKQDQGDSDGQTDVWAHTENTASLWEISGDTTSDFSITVASKGEETSEGEETCANVNNSQESIVRESIQLSEFLNVSEKDTDPKLAVQEEKDEKNREEESVTKGNVGEADKVAEEPEQSEKNAQEMTEGSVTVDEGFTLELNEQIGSSDIEHSQLVETKASFQRSEKKIRGAKQESGVTTKRILRGKKSATASPEQRSTRTSRRLRQDEMEDKSEVEAIGEEEKKPQQKRKAIVEPTPRRSKRLARTEMV